MSPGTKYSYSAGRIPRDRADKSLAPINVDLLRLALAEPANEGSNAVPPADLNVPFHEKDDAKRLGARWERACWHCHRDSRVFSFLLPRGHQTRQDSDESVYWEPHESEAIIYYIT